MKSGDGGVELTGKLALLRTSFILSRCDRVSLDAGVMVVSLTIEMKETIEGENAGSTTSSQKESGEE